MYARAQALVAPISSNTAPRSQVSNDSIIAANTRAEVMKRCQFGFQGSWGNQRFSMTSRHTNASRGKVVNILRPKQLDFISRK